jgi:uncharacterized protein YpmS
LLGLAWSCLVLLGLAWSCLVLLVLLVLLVHVATIAKWLSPGSHHSQIASHTTNRVRGSKLKTTRDSYLYLIQPRRASFKRRMPCMLMCITY